MAVELASLIVQGYSTRFQLQAWSAQSIFLASTWKAWEGSWRATPRSALETEEENQRNQHDLQKDLATELHFSCNPCGINPELR